MKMNNKVYDVLKWIALICLPASGTLYSTLSDIWGLPYGGKIAATVLAVETFLGVILGISNYKYKKANK